MMNADMIERAKGMYSPMELQSRTIQNAVNIMVSFAESETQAITAERDKYRDACERLIGHYGDPKNWADAPLDAERVVDSLYVGTYRGFDFARQVKAELEAE